MSRLIFQAPFRSTPSKRISLWIRPDLRSRVCAMVRHQVQPIHARDAGDTPQLPPLVKTTAKSFNVKEVSADKGYSGQERHDAIAGVGAYPVHRVLPQRLLSDWRNLRALEFSRCSR